MAAVGHQPGQPPRHRVAQPERVLGGQLEHQRGGERLGDAADLVTQPGAHRLRWVQDGHAAGSLPGLLVVPCHADGARLAAGNQFIQQLLEFGARQARRACLGGCGWAAAVAASSPAAAKIVVAKEAIRFICFPLSQTGLSPLAAVRA